jgi:putative oxidoreductase
MSPAAASKGRVAVIWFLKVLLGAVFLAIGFAKLSGTLQTVQFFDAIGWGQWFRFATGFLDVAGAALLFVKPWTFYGALLLASTIGSATLICITILHQNPAVPLALALLATTLAFLIRLTDRTDANPKSKSS